MIFVDADSCEKNAREFILNTAVKKNLKVIFAANKNIPFSFSNPLFKMKYVPKKKIPQTILLWKIPSRAI